MRILLNLIFFFSISCSILIAQPSPIASFLFDNDPDSTQTTDEVSGTVFSILNHYQSPERVNAVNGKALRLDGFSTWASNNNFSLSNVSNKLAVEAWYATEAFNEKRVGLVCQQGGNDGFELSIGSFGNVIFEFNADGTKYTLTSNATIERYVWHHILVQVDLPAQTAELFINGQLDKTISLSAHTGLSLSNSTFYIGRTNESDDFAGFLLTVANGALDELNIYNNTLTPAQIQSAAMAGAGTDAEADLFIDPNVRHGDDYLRPRYHPMPNTSWTNESYGLTYFDSTYHIFFQKNSNAPSLYFMHWGHLTSPDLVNWKEERMPLAPTPGFSSFGVWSGTTAFDTLGMPFIATTGVNGAKAGIAIVSPKDSSLIEWEPMPATANIPNPPTAFNHMDFRDPWIWEDDGTYYMIVGSGLQNEKGGILFTYRSTNLKNWINIFPLYRSDNTNQSGLFWEMPAFLKLTNDLYALVVTPFYGSGRKAETLYWVGTWDGTEFTPLEEEPKQFEHISQHLLSPAFGKDEADRTIYSGIIPDDRSIPDQVAAGWRHTFSIPRVARLLNDNHLGHYAHPNLCRLRHDHVQITNREFLPNSNNNLAEFSGNQVEMTALLIPEEDAEFSLQVFKNAAATEFTSIDFNLKDNILGLNRSLSSPYITNENNRWKKYVFGDTVRVQVFLDHSIMEVFVDNLAVLSARVYPGQNSLNFDLIVQEGKVNAPQMDLWKLYDKENANMPDSVCEPDYLPNVFFSPTSIEELEIGDRKFFVYPNPAQEYLNIECEGVSCGNLDQYTIKLFSSDGRQQLQHQLSQSSAISLEAYPAGMYFLQISNGSAATTKKIIIQ